MTFYTIQSPGNRNEEVKKYLELKRYLRAKDSAEQTGDYTRLEELSKYFKPVTQPLQEIKKDVKTLPSELVKALPANTQTKPTTTRTTKPQRLIEGFDVSKIKTIETQDTKDGFDVRIAGVPLKIYEGDIEYKGVTYKKTPELLKLLFSNDPPTDLKVRSPESWNDYKEIMKASNSLIVPGAKPGTYKYNNTIKSSGTRWKYIVKPIADEIKQELQSGTGLKSPSPSAVFLSSNPVTLADRLELLCAAAKAGNTGVRNEMVEICKELVRMGAMNRQQKNQILKNYISS